MCFVFILHLSAAHNHSVVAPQWFFYPTARCISFECALVILPLLNQSIYTTHALTRMIIIINFVLFAVASLRLNL